MPAHKIPLAKRLFSRLIIDPESGCLLWTGYLKNNGYAQIQIGIERRQYLVHRVMYELFIGPIPPGFQVDHLCHTRRCASPAHLEAVTPRVNTLRSTGITAERAVRTHCPAGHEYDLLNTYWHGGSRSCKECSRQRVRTRRALCGR
jgi:hypothetical protein